MNTIRKISLGNWILIAMVLGLLVGLILNQFVDNHFIKDVILMDNVFYLGGNIFVRLLKMLVVPLVFFSIVVGISSIADIRKIAWINVRTFLLYFITLVIGISIAIVMASVLQPGVGMTLAGNATSAAGLNQTMTDMVLNVIPENPLNALAKGEMIPVILFALIIGLILAKYKQKTPVVDTFFEEFNKIEFQADYSDWIDMLDGFKDAARDAKRRRMFEREEDIVNHNRSYHGVNPVDFIRQLSLAMDDDAVYVADVGQNQMWSCSNYVARGGRFMTSGGMGTMGYALPAAMGAKVAAPGRQVVAVCGDGGFQMTMQELATVMQYKIPVKLVILKNTVLGLVRQYQHYNYKDRYSVIDLGALPDLSMIAKAYGIGYLKIDNASETDEKLAAFLDKDESMILEVTVDRDELC